MFLRCLKLAGIRNLATQTVEPGSGVNLFVGANGAGKTSLLEAIFLLARGRSFRAQVLDTMVSRGATSCSVYGELVIDGPGDTEVIRRLGVSRETGGGFCYRLDGATVNAASTLADTLPLLLINSDSLGLLGGSPKTRRHFLDWGLFHTLPEARQLWRQHLRAHQQRNALLRRGIGVDRRELDLWDRKFAETGELITVMRCGYAGEIAPVAARFTEALSPGLGNLELGFQAGWDRDQSLADALKLHRDRDIMLRATQSGPHRADLKIRLNGRLATESLSRGQSKVFALALLLAQGAHFLQRRGCSCLNLIDDLPAELDQWHRRRVAQLMAEIGGQSFVTGTDVAQMGADWMNVSAAPAVKMFHVEQGRFIESLP
jgi:DNA replication and repair protein RecF